MATVLSQIFNISAMLAFAIVTLVGIIAYSRYRSLRAVWTKAVRRGAEENLTVDELSQPWSSRTFQRAYVYLAASRIAFSMAFLAILTVLSARVDTTALGIYYEIVKICSPWALIITSLQFATAASSGLKAEYRSLSKLFPDKKFSIDTLREYTEQDKEINLDRVKDYLTDCKDSDQEF